MLAQERPDFVDIITRPETHQPLVELAAGSRVAIMCQKPLAPTFQEARRLVETAAAEDVRLMVHENFRFQPWHRELKRLLNDGVTGRRLHSIACRTRMGDGWQDNAYADRQPYFRTMPRFLLHETGVHFIDTFRYLAGEIDGVYAELRRLNPAIAGEDSGVVICEFASGARGLWDANRYNEAACRDPRYTFGQFLIEADGGSIRLDEDGRMTIQPLGQRPRLHEYHPSQQGFADDCVLATQRHFVDALRSGTPFETSGTDYMQTLRVVEAAYESARTGLPQRGLAGGSAFPTT